MTPTLTESSDFLTVQAWDEMASPAGRQQRGPAGVHHLRLSAITVLQVENRSPNGPYWVHLGSNGYAISETDYQRLCTALAITAVPAIPAQP